MASRRTLGKPEVKREVIYVTEAMRDNMIAMVNRAGQEYRDARDNVAAKKEDVAYARITLLSVIDRLRDDVANDRPIGSWFAAPPERAPKEEATP